MRQPTAQDAENLAKHLEWLAAQVRERVPRKIDVGLDADAPEVDPFEGISTTIYTGATVEIRW